MRFNVYPQRYRRWARQKLKLRKCFPVCFALCLLVGVAQACLKNEIAALLFLMASFCFLIFFFAMKSAHDELSSIEIDENGIRLLADDGDVLRSTVYRYVRNMEIRTIPITFHTGEQHDRGLFAINYGAKEKLIFIYLDAANCFEDLKLEKLDWSGEGFCLHAKVKEYVYLCSQLFYHPSCMVLSYDAEAWNLLEMYWRKRE